MFPLQPTVCLFIQKTKRTSNKALKLKEKQHQSNKPKRKQYQALKKNNINLFMYKEKEKKMCARPKKFPVQRVKGLGCSVGQKTYPWSKCTIFEIKTMSTNLPSSLSA